MSGSLYVIAFIFTLIILQSSWNVAYLFAYGRLVQVPKSIVQGSAETQIQQQQTITPNVTWINSSLLSRPHSPQQVSLCNQNTKLCSYGQQVKSIVKSRARFESDGKKVTTNRQVFIHGSVRNMWGEPIWLSPQALQHCPGSCSLTSDASSADIVVYCLMLPSDGGLGKVNVILNLEPMHFAESSSTNTILMSYHQDSDLVINYAYSIMHVFSLCVGDAQGSTQYGLKCENMLEKESPFYHWCSRTFDGDFFTCVFNVVPHIARTNAVNKSADALAVAWISATCERHNLYLAELMKHIKIDSMGGCYRNSDEQNHPALRLADVDSIWWGNGAFPTGPNGNRKMLIASHYKFYISLENTIMDDYVTEKFFEGLLTDSVMVYLGAPNARQYAPVPNSFISALDFEGPAALASFLIELAADEARYKSFSAWRHDSPMKIQQSFKDAMQYDPVRLDNQSLLCRMCNFANA